MAKTISTKILMLADIKSATNVYAMDNVDKIGKVDLVICAGSLTANGALGDYKKVMDLLQTIDTPLILIVAGCRDTSLDSEYYLSDKGGQPRGKDLHGDAFAPEVPERAMSLLHSRSKGDKKILYLSEGIHPITLDNGARFWVYASPFTLYYENWAFSHKENEDRFNPRGFSTFCASRKGDKPMVPPEFGKISIVITNGAPKSILDEWEGIKWGCPHLFRADTRALPLIHCFGNCSISRGAEYITWGDDVSYMWQRKGAIESYDRVDVRDDGTLSTIDISSKGPKPLVPRKQTLMVNATVSNRSNKPCHAPFVVTADLPSD